MLAQEPSRVTRRFLYALLLFLATAVVVAAVVHVDVTVTAPAILIPEGKALAVQPEVGGTVVELSVEEGTRVAKGDVLVVLDSEKAGEQLFTLSEAALKWKNAVDAVEKVLPLEIEKNEDEIKSLEEEIASLGRERTHLQRKRKHEDQAFKLLDDVYAEQVRKLDEAEQRLDSDLKIAAQTQAYRVRQLDSTAQAYELRAVSQLEFLAARRDVEEAKNNLEKVQSQIREAKNDRTLATKNYLRDSQQHHKALAEIDQDLERNAARAREDRGKILKLRSERRLKELETTTNERTARLEYDLARQKAELTRGPLNRRTVDAVARGTSPVVGRVLVTAPCAGRIGSVKVRRQGEAVERGQTLMTLLPDGPLVAEVRVANKDVGLVRPGQSVKLKLDAFPFAEYGSVRGELVNVPPDAEGVDTPGDSFYRASARLDDQAVRKNGSSVALVSGMTATAEVITERKTVLELLLTPLLEPFQN
jgi:HlyD family secretion protein